MDWGLSPQTQAAPASIPHQLGIVFIQDSLSEDHKEEVM